MTYTVDNGPPKTFATHLWTPYAGDPAFTLNDRTAYPAIVYPWVKVEGIGGWRDLPETADNRAPKSYGIGEVVYPNRTLGKTLTYKIDARALNEADIEKVVNAMVQSFGDQDKEGTMTVTAYDASIVWTFTARVIAFTMEDEYSYEQNRTYQFNHPGSVTFRMSDPRFYTGGVGYL